jgi:hypothetical protein
MHPGQAASCSSAHTSTCAHVTGDAAFTHACPNSHAGGTWDDGEPGRNGSTELQSVFSHQQQEEHHQGPHNRDSNPAASPRSDRTFTASPPGIQAGLTLPTPLLCTP